MQSNSHVTRRLKYGRPNEAEIDGSGSKDGGGHIFRILGPTNIPKTIWPKIQMNKRREIDNLQKRVGIGLMRNAVYSGRRMPY